MDHEKPEQDGKPQPKQQMRTPAELYSAWHQGGAAKLAEMLEEMPDEEGE